MDVNLIKLPFDELLEKFGAGSHKPGSGSAAAHQGLLSSKLILTVIQLSTDEKRKTKYGEHRDRFMEMKNAIETRIFPSLVKLFQDDSYQFDLAIKARKERDREVDENRKRLLAIKALQALKPATEMPIQVAELCEELADFAAYVFDYGFSSVRGDSGVALNCAVSGIGGCLSIIDLNLLSFRPDEWTKGIERRAALIRSRFGNLAAGLRSRMQALRDEVEANNVFYAEFDSLLTMKSRYATLTYAEIEQIATQLQNCLWKYRGAIWKTSAPDDPLDIIEPRRALKAIGYEVNELPSLGRHEIQNGIYEIAGLIDNRNRIVLISGQFPPDVRNFTMAHELGHALLHDRTILHRDRALNGGSISEPRSPEELQADKFASFFLMPRKQVTRVFRQLFGLKKFVINDDTVFALKREGRPSDFRAKCKDVHGLAKFIAGLEFYNGKSFDSLSKIFEVSEDAMAIQLEELGLVEF